MPSDPNDIIDHYSDEIIDDNHVAEDYDDMYVGESRTSDYNAAGFTVLPISDISDKKDQSDLEHETESSIDLWGNGSDGNHEMRHKPLDQVPTENEQEETTTTRRRQSILITPPLRPRNKSSVKTDKPSTFQTSTKTTFKTAASKVTSRSLPITSSTTSVTTSTTTTLSSSSTSTSAAIKASKVSSTTIKGPFMTSVPGGVMVNARSKQTPPPRFMEPKFVFTTESSTFKTVTTTLEEKMTTITTAASTKSTESTSSSTNTTPPTTSSSEESNSIYSHHFDLAEETDVEIVNKQGEMIANKNKTVYNTVTTTTTVPSYDELQVINKTLTESNTINMSKPVNLSVPRLRSDLYDVMTNENATEVITIGQVTELERMPRGNDEIEPLDDAYKRLEARYGGWENSAGRMKTMEMVLMISVIFSPVFML